LLRPREEGSEEGTPQGQVTGIYVMAGPQQWRFN